MGPTKILALDDDPQMHTLYRSILLKSAERKIDFALDLDQAQALLRSNHYDIAIIDLRIKGNAEAGFTLLEELQAQENPPQCLVISAERNFESAQRALRLRADDYIAKGFLAEELLFVIARAEENKRLKRIERSVMRELAAPNRYQILGATPAIITLKENIKKLGPKAIPVLIHAETGTGKELVARNLHHYARAPTAPFVALDCANIPLSMAEGYLFGHEKGAFTGADRASEGIFEQANGGTLFLDEIGCMSLEIQAKFLRVLQEKEFCRLGSTKKISVDFRLVAAANQDLEILVGKGEFKQDLLYRISGIVMEIPPLRQRREDIPIFLANFLPGRKWEPELGNLLEQYSWPGNIRELRNLCMSLDALAEPAAIIAISDLPEALLKKILKEQKSSLETEDVEIDFQTAKRIREQEFLHKAYLAAEGNISKMARTLKVDRSHLHQKLKQLGIRD